MTALLDLHPTPGHPGAVVASVHEALDELGPVDAASGGTASAVVSASGRSVALRR